MQRYIKKWVITLLSSVCLSFSAISQIDSLAQNIVDTIKSKLIVDDIPKKTLFDKFMYPHRLYVKRRLEKTYPSFDTTYIKTNKYKLTLGLPIAKKFYGFSINDLQTNRMLKVSPNHFYQVGFNLSNLILTFGIFPGIRFGDDPKRGKTTGINLQVTVIGKRIITDINVQNYRGFYTYTQNEFEYKSLNPSLYNVRPDLRLFSFGINTMYVFNSKKYSLRGAFSFADIQRKSAGSWMAGIYHSYTELRSEDTTIVTAPFRNEFSPLVNTMQKISSTTLGVHGGYGYTYVYKKIIFSNCINIGAGGQTTSYFIQEDNSKTKEPLSGSLHVNIKSTLRYDNLRFFTGILGTYDNTYDLSATDIKTESYLAKVIVFVGYRFKVDGKKLLRAMKLIDYNKKRKKK